MPPRPPPPAPLREPLVEHLPIPTILAQPLPPHAEPYIAAPLPSEHHATPNSQTLTWRLLQGLVLLHTLPLMYWIFLLVKSSVRGRRKTFQPAQRIKLTDVNKLRQLRRMID